MKTRMNRWMHDSAMLMVMQYALLWLIALLAVAGYAQTRSAHKDTGSFQLNVPTKNL